MNKSKPNKSNLLVFVIKFVALLLIVAVIVLLLNSYYVKGNYYNTIFGEVKMFHDVPYGITMANTGTSHGMASFDYRDVEGETTFNFALSGEDIYHDFQTLKQFSDHLSEGCIVAIPVSYLSFCWSLDEPSQTRYYEYMDKDMIRGFNYEVLINVKYAPVLRSGEFLFKDLINDETLDFGAVFADDEPVDTGTPSSGGSGSATSDESAKIQAMEKALKAHAVGRAEGWRSGYMIVGDKYMDGNAQLLIDMINYCKDKGWRPVLVTTPIHDTLNAEFTDEELEYYFYSNVRKVVESTNVPYLDVSHDEQFSSVAEYYGNSDHLNSKGAAAYMEVYLEYLEEIGYR